MTKTMGRPRRTVPPEANVGPGLPDSLDQRPNIRAEMPFTATPASPTSPNIDEAAVDLGIVDFPWLTSQPPNGLPDRQLFEPEQHYIPCLMHNEPVDGDSIHDRSGLTPVSSQNSCRCAKEVSQYFEAMDDRGWTIEQINLLRQSLDLANRVLNCNVCFNILDVESSISKNILLLGALMSNIALSYAQFISLHKERISRAGEDDGRVKVFFGQHGDPGSLVDVNLSHDCYWWLLKTALSSDLGRLLELCTAFEARQLKAHELGHEQCAANTPCMAGSSGLTTAISKYTKACPRNVDPKKAFSCFSTVNQVFAAIRETQNMVESA